MGEELVGHGEDELRRGLEAGLMPFGDSPTSPLAHYTTFEGMKGILSERRIWATESRYLNDASERSFAADQLEKLFQTQENLYPGTIVPTMIAEAREYLKSRFDQNAHFVACFCEGSDLLSMWSPYAAAGGGYALEFDGPRIAQLARLPSAFFFKVLYGAPLPGHPLVDAFARSCKNMAENTKIDPKMAAVAPMLVSPLELCFIRLKDEAFEHEKEWRAVAIVPLDPFASPYTEMEFRSSSAAPRPFIRLSLPPEIGAESKKVPPLPLLRVVVGPTLRHADTIRSVRWLLRKYGYPDTVDVVMSRVPYRAP